MQEIIDRISKLLALATSPNEYEASAAAAKAQEILTAYNLEIKDIKTNQKSPDIPIEQIIISTDSRKVYWKGFIANAIANANFCQMWWMGGKMVIVGRRHNAAIVLSLYDYLIKTVERLATEKLKAEKQSWHTYLRQIEGTGIEPFAQPNWRRWKSSFITGCSKRLIERIREQTQQMNAQGIPDTEVTGLACRMAREREREAIALWQQERGIVISQRKSASKAKVNKDGYNAGQRAGDAISLERQLSSNNGQLLR